MKNKEEKKNHRWQTAISVLLLFLIGSLINIPFSREVKRLNIEAGMSNVRLNESVLDDVITIGISSLVLGTILVFIGLWFSAKTNLGAPLITRFFSKLPVAKLIDWKAIFSSVILATVVALILLGLFELQKELYPVVGKISRPSKPFYALVAFSAGISEEIMFRLGLMSLIIAILQFFRKVDNPTNKMIWTGIIISALFFGLIHLPLSKNFVELTPFSIGVTMVGNLITGSTFGWIFWKRGLLVAIMAHIVFDLVFHVIGTPFT
ncbi:CPBP family intramembrane glutamic endopeptidase [Maribacter ulvicola]|uniref:CAAX protease self-immunity n=1 Tax=Maribacter ulvicola TaxID=228959 RepID=A0A1N6U9X4_9FLAO|nr:CPBP family intramembrane glutamic endopeptidase [Maribacter ulvicola]SIQ62412.1 CAAX protease self-immunity [Maribacter ulvicola]